MKTNSTQPRDPRRAHSARDPHANHPVLTKRKAQADHKLHIYGACAVVVLFAGVLSTAAYYVAQTSSLPIADADVTVPNATTTPVGPDAYAHISLIGKAAIVYDLTNGQTLYAQNANVSMPLASVTKLLTLYAASGILSPASTVTMTPQSVAQDNDAADIGFKAGESFTFEDLARLTLAASSNNGAEAITEAADAAKATDTTSLMAGAASAIGLTQTHATNGTGLDINSEMAGGYGSAHDVAVLAGALLEKAPLIAQATTQPYVSITSTQGTTHTFSNTDINITHIPDPLLSKTGYTDLAGGNLVVVYDAAINHPVAIVVLGSTESGRFTDIQQLVNATLGHFAGLKPATTASSTTE